MKRWMGRSRIARLAALVSLSVLASGAADAQLESGPGPESPLTGDLAKLLGTVSVDERKATPLLPEGTFISAREARLVVTKKGDRVLALSPDQSDPVARALILLPCAELEKLERAAIEAGDAGEATRFKVTGQVFAYHRYNYVLLSTWTQLIVGDEPDAPATEPGSEIDPDEVSALIRELEQSREEPGRALGGERSPVWLPPRSELESGEGTLVPDRTLVQSRRARLVRQGVAWTIAFDSGPESKRADPMIVLPCLHHERLERLTHAAGDEIEIEISGRVLAFHGRNYILPTLFQVISGREISPIQ